MSIFHISREKIGDRGLRIGKNIAAATAVAAVLGTGGYSAWRLIDQKFAEVNVRVLELSNDFAQSKVEIASLRRLRAAEVERLEKEIGGLAENYSRLERLYADLAKSVGQERNELAQVKSQSDKALTDLTALASFTGELARGLDSLTDVVSTNARFINQVAAGLKEVKSTVKHNITALNELSSRVMTNATTLNELLMRVTTMDEWIRKSFEGVLKISGELSKVSDMFVAAFVRNILDQKPDFDVTHRDQSICTLHQENPNNPIHSLTVAYDNISDPPSWGTGKYLKPDDVVVSFTEYVASVKVPLSDMKPSDGVDFPSAVNELSRPLLKLQPWGAADNSFLISNEKVRDGELPSFLFSLAEAAKSVCDAATVEPGGPPGPDKDILIPYPIAPYSERMTGSGVVLVSKRPFSLN